MEREVYEFILSLYNKEIIRNDRTVLNGKELDIYLPDYNLAIEFNGLYWHSEDYVGKNYHLNKTIECEKK
jgi:G:T-mismatch repair DNA endonuclease (very short patch repair protein)